MPLSLPTHEEKVMVTGSVGSGTGPCAADSEACGLPPPPPPHAASRVRAPAASSGTILALVRLLIEPLLH